MKSYKISSYNKFINESKEDIRSICGKYGIRNYTINDDGTVDVDGGVKLSSKGLNRLPLKFRKVTGHFECSHNKLASLEGSPQEIGGGFYCNDNELTTLEFLPKVFTGLLYTDGIYCDDNKLTSLEGCPEKIVGDFYCSRNYLTSLDGSPKEACNDFYCDGNKLTSLKGAPHEIGGGFYCYDNEITDVKGFPLTIKGDIHINENPIEEIFKLFHKDLRPYLRRPLPTKLLDVVEFLNEYDVIRDSNKVVLQALELVYDELGLEVPENIEIEGYEII